ncbi:prolyl oligopeptidase family serine peptidase [Fontisphaera persica]|uniref:DPP IV N-terminal domain-containing protein n=1 Tax=Fontisphaera persica TaxID=2974023 RepID=UPI0024C00E50|nr:DPP IV N-terminal domain-containing protein [Fontisphaera persica]WCJ57935.1 prolyl oligopeptidase family serine peptidase [Fontisphaera persica]
MLMVWLCLLAAGTTGLKSQITREDYQRAFQWSRLCEGKVLNARLTPHWFAGGERFWYRKELAGGAREFVVVDAVRGERRPAFDHARLAEALSRALKKEVPSHRLPMDALEWDAAGQWVQFRAEGKSWRLALASYALSEVPREAAKTENLAASRNVRPSRRTGEETSIRFINRTGQEVRLFWINPEGRPQAYGTLAAGAERDQHTFAGHVWQVTDGDGNTVAVFEAVEGGGEAVIEKPNRAAPSPAATEPARAARSREGLSPDGQWQAFYRENNVFLRRVSDQQEFALSTDGTAEDRYEGRFYWAPDSRKLVVMRVKQGDTRKVYYVESSPKDQLQPKLHSYDYLKPGDRVPQPMPQLFDVAQRRKIEIVPALFENPWSNQDVRWAADSSQFTFVHNRRGHQILRLIAVNAATGEARALIDERSATFIDYSGKFFLHYLERSGELIWMSERDGWNHLYLYDARTGKVKHQMTRGPWVVRGVERVDEERRQIWFRAGGIHPGQDPYYVHYARVNFDGSQLTLLTEGNGTHTVQFSPDRRFFIDTWSRVDAPPVHELRRAEDGRLVCVLETADASAMSQLGWRLPEPFVAKGRDGQTDIYGVIWRPTRLDPGKKYPVVERIYAGPQGSFTPKNFQPSHQGQAYAELGFIVVQMDGMGTSHRSKAFHDVCWKNLGDAGFPDRILWMKAAAQKYPYMDLSRVGIFGGSAGGQNAARALIAHPDFYKVAVADCGCHDNRMDKIWWNEQWMGWPVGPHYAEQSNVTQAHRLQGKLMLIVGEMDENVDPASTMQVVNALIKADKDFDLLVIPGVGHGAAETPYGNRRRMDFLVRHLHGIEPRNL